MGPTTFTGGLSPYFFITSPFIGHPATVRGSGGPRKVRSNGYRGDGDVKKRRSNPNYQEKSRLLQSDFSCPQKKRRLASSDRFVGTEQISDRTTLQDGKHPISHSSHTPRRLGRDNRSGRRLFPRPSSPRLPTLHQVCVERTRVPIQGSMFWPGHCTPGVYPFSGSSGGFLPCPQPLPAYLPGRLAAAQPITRETIGTPVLSPQSNRGSRLHRKSQKVVSHSVPRLRLHRSSVPHRSRSVMSTNETSRKHSIVIPDTLPREKSNSSRYSAMAGTGELRGRQYSLGKVVHAPYADVTPLTVAPTQRPGSAPSAASSTSPPPHVELLAQQGQSGEGKASNSTNSRQDSGDGCFPRGMGRQARGPIPLGSLVHRRETTPYQCIGTLGRREISQDPNDQVDGLSSSSTKRQYHSRSVSEQTGRNQVINAVLENIPAPDLVPLTEDHDSLRTYSRTAESDSRCSFQRKDVNPDRMVAATALCELSTKAVAKPDDRPLCKQAESSATHIRIGSNRSSSDARRCPINVVEQPNSVCVPTDSTSTYSSGKSQIFGKLQSYFDSTSLATACVVSMPVGTSVGPSPRPRGTPGSSLSPCAQTIPSQPRYLQPSRLACVERSLVKRGFSVNSAKRIAQPQRPSTTDIYESKWRVFANWCSKSTLDPLHPTIQAVTDFLVHLKESVGSAPSTIRGYRSAIASTLRPIGSWDDSWDSLLTNLVKNISNESHVTQSPIPKWDIGLVINFLSTLEPLESLDMERLTLKVVFLTAMACSGRVSQIHALSDVTHFASDRSLVKLNVNPAFLAKTQIPGQRPSPLYFDALPESDSSVCPVRAIYVYLTRTRDIRNGRRTLFLPWKDHTNLPGKRSISSWLVRTVNLAYLACNQSPPHRVTAHEVRALSTSLAWDRGVGLEEFVAAGIWSSTTSFRRRYFRDMSSMSATGVKSLVLATRRVSMPSKGSI